MNLEYIYPIEKPTRDTVNFDVILINENAIHIPLPPIKDGIMKDDILLKEGEKARLFYSGPDVKTSEEMERINSDCWYIHCSISVNTITCLEENIKLGWKWRDFRGYVIIRKRKNNSIISNVLYGQPGNPMEIELLDNLLYIQK